MARWSCRTAARICAVPALRICCNGPMHSGRNSASAGRKAEIEPRALIPQKDLLRSAAATVRNTVTAFPKKHFPAIHPRRREAPSGHLPVTMIREPVVRVANTDISGCDCSVVRGGIPRTSTGCCFEGRQGTGKGSGQTCALSGGQARACTRGKADGQTCGTGGGRCCRRCGAHPDRSVRDLGRLHGDAERQKGLL